MKLKNLALRVLVAIFGIPLILSCLYFGGYYLLGLILVIVFVSQFEFYKIAEKKSALPLKTVGLLVGLLVPIMFYFRGLNTIAWILPLSLLAILLIELFRKKQNAMLNIAATFLGIIYPSIFLSFLILIREFPKLTDIPYRTGGLWLIVVIITIWICDTAAFFIGSAIGKHKLYERISPHKTLEGGIAGFVFAIITVVIFYRLFPSLFRIAQYLTIGIIVGIFSQVGDLVESLFKRDAGIKDSSAILPGHGGFLDRFDAPMFLAPIVYYYITLLIF